jgi:hypothetical protein
MHPPSVALLAISRNFNRLGNPNDPTAEALSHRQRSTQQKRGIDSAATAVGEAEENWPTWKLLIGCVTKVRHQTM